MSPEVTTDLSWFCEPSDNLAVGGLNSWPVYTHAETFVSTLELDGSNNETGS